MNKDNRLTIRFKYESDLKNLNYICKILDTNPNALVQYIIKAYIKNVKSNFDKDSKKENDARNKRV